MLLMNKSDFLPPAMRRRWAAYFATRGVDVIFFSAIRELHKQRISSSTTRPSAFGEMPSTAEGFLAEGTKDPLTREPLVQDVAELGGSAPDRPDVPHGPLSDEGTDVLDCGQLLEELLRRLPEEPGDGGERGVIGFVGYPNVGKSTVINALFGSKKVSMSRTPGKTKHLQTLELPEFGVTLCDCPGLVFPSVVASKAHLVINGTVPLTELKDAMGPARLVVEKVGLGLLLEKYCLSPGAMREAAHRLGDEDAASDQPRSFLAALAVTRQHFLR